MFDKKLFVLILALLISSVAVAEGDAAAGQAKSGTCAGCHMADGNSMNGEWPKLAGQHPEYLQRQLSLFKTGERNNPIMMGMAAALSDQDMADLAAYFSAQKRSAGAADAKLVALGKKIYRGGIRDDRNVVACMACHGPDGKGNGPAGYPSLASQHSKYIETQLKSFRKGVVWGKGDNANKTMSGVVKYLSDEEIAAVASYIQGLH
ncbi:MAG: c-type cytochrome [bacterium]